VIKRPVSYRPVIESAAEGLLGVVFISSGDSGGGSGDR
jgi:hypothetical protein